MSESRETCPSCRSDRVVLIVYGHPGPELRARAALGEIALGGCLRGEGESKKKCLACGLLLEPTVWLGRPTPPPRPLSEVTDPTERSVREYVRDTFGE